MGAMGLTAALTGLLTALVPVVFELFHEGLPAPLTALGLAAGCLAIWLITHSPATNGARTAPKALLFGALAGVGFGAQLILFKMAGAGGVLWTLTTGRIAGVVALLLFLAFTPPPGPWRGFWIMGVLSGSLDTIGNLFYMLTAQLGRLDVAAVICSLYPAGNDPSRRHHPSRASHPPSDGGHRRRPRRRRPSQPLNWSVTYKAAIKATMLPPCPRH